MDLLREGLIVMKLGMLQENRNAIGQHIERLTQLNERLRALLGRIESSWEGDASAAYLRLMMRYADEAADMVKVLEEFGSYVEKAISTFEAADKSAASRIMGSF